MLLRAHATRLMLLALAGVWVLLGVVVGGARADEYGGLDPLAGKNGAHLEVNPRSHRAFGVAPDGSSYIAEETQTGEEHFLRVQKVGAQGEYIAETKVKLAGPTHQLDGVAIDAEKQRFYVLAVIERNPEEETPVFDPEVPAAAELFAFSTEANEGKLEPAAGTPTTGKEVGVLAGRKVLNPLSEAESATARPTRHSGRSDHPRRADPGLAGRID